MTYTDHSGRADPVEDVSDDEGTEICAIVDESGEHTECTLFPEDAEGVTLMSRWITADEGSFVALSAMQ